MALFGEDETLSEVPIENQNNDKSFTSSMLKEDRSNSFDKANPVDELSDIKVKVQEYQKIVTNLETYISFTIWTQGGREEFKEDEYLVHRRYSDFEWLFNRLEESHPVLILPPLPDKHSISQLERFTGPFIELRRASLERFLRRLVSHPVLSASEDLFIFLTAQTASHFQQYRNAHTTSIGRFSRFLEDIQSKTQGRSTGASMDISVSGSDDGSLTGIDPNAPDIEQDLFEITAFGDVMGRMSRVATRIAFETETWSTDMTDLGESLLQWAACEAPATAECLVTVARAVEAVEAASTTVGPNIRKNLAPQFHEYELYSANAKATIRRRNKIRRSLFIINEAIGKLEQEIVSGLPTTTGPTSTLTSLIKGKETVEQKQERLNRMTANATNLTEQLARATSDLQMELTRWKAIQRREVAAILCNMADTQVDLYTQCEEGWKTALEALNQSHSTSLTN